MTSAERQRALDYLEQTKAAILASTAAFTEAQWRFKPLPEQWSAAECVEHIAVVEQSLLRTLQRLAAGPAGAEEALASTRGKDELILRAVPRRRGKVQAPEPARPSNRWPDTATLIASFTAIRDQTILYVRSTDHPLRSVSHPHIIFGPLDGYQWLLFLAAHSDRHLKQLLELVSPQDDGRIDPQSPDDGRQRSE
jgi:hypothetical protein